MRMRRSNAGISSLLKNQFSADAIHTENSPAYHLFATKAFKQVINTGLFPEHSTLTEITERAIDHNFRMYHPNGDLVQIGDSGGRGLEHPVDMVE